MEKYVNNDFAHAIYALFSLVFEYYRCKSYEKINFTNEIR